MSEAGRRGCVPVVRDSPDGPLATRRVPAVPGLAHSRGPGVGHLREAVPHLAPATAIARHQPRPAAPGIQSNPLQTPQPKGPSMTSTRPRGWATAVPALALVFAPNAC